MGYYIWLFILNLMPAITALNLSFPIMMLAFAIVFQSSTFIHNTIIKLFNLQLKKLEPDDSGLIKHFKEKDTLILTLISPILSVFLFVVLKWIFSDFLKVIPAKKAVEKSTEFYLSIFNERALSFALKGYLFGILIFATFITLIMLISEYRYHKKMKNN